VLVLEVNPVLWATFEAATFVPAGKQRSIGAEFAQLRKTHVSPERRYVVLFANSSPRRWDVDTVYLLLDWAQDPTRSAFAKAMDAERDPTIRIFRGLTSGTGAAERLRGYHFYDFATEVNKLRWYVARLQPQSMQPAGK
jgi:hypothetical protein